MGGKDDAVASIISSLTGSSGTVSLNRATGHHGPQTDMLLGKGGAQFSGQTYSNSKHTELADANCVNCHMANDFSGTDITEGRNLSPAVGGHSFTITGIVHGTPAANNVGCGYTGCHVTTAADGTKTYTTSNATYSANDGFRRKGDAYIKKGTGTSAYDAWKDISPAIKAMADPDKNCIGLISKAYNTVAGKTVTNNITWATYPDGNTPTVRCDLGTNNVNKYASPQSTDNAAQLLMATWNYMFIMEDKSFGIHNTTYTRQLAYDSCEALKKIVGDTTTSCGTRP